MTIVGSFQEKRRLKIEIRSEKMSHHTTEGQSSLVEGLNWLLADEIDC